MATDKNQPIEQRLDALVDALNVTRQQLNQSQVEIQALQRELQSMRQQGTIHQGETAQVGEPTTPLADAVAQLQENQEVLQAEVAQHDQSKVETRSKYGVKLTGLVLFNAFTHDGAVDHIDAPGIALKRTPDMASGSTGATMRQTILGFDGTGPSVFGGQSQGDVRVDFFAGLLPSGYSTSEGLLRLRTAHVSLNWPKTDVTAMLDRPIFSPLNPTSLAVSGVAPLAWAGNLWAWAPQITVAHRVHLGQYQFGVEAGVIDVADPPATTLSAAERSRYPGSEARLSYSGTRGSHTAAIGIGGYWGPHRYDRGEDTNAWAVTADGVLSLPAHVELSGEFYRGRSLGGLGGGVYKDIILVKPGISPEAPIQGLNTLGGWSQVKFRMTDKLEFNAAGGQEDGFARQLRQAQLDSSNPYSALARNQTFFGNFIYKLSPYVLFSFEYRKIRSWPIHGSANTAESYVLTTGYEF